MKKGSNGSTIHLISGVDIGKEPKKRFEFKFWFKVDTKYLPFIMYGGAFI